MLGTQPLRGANGICRFDSDRERDLMKSLRFVSCVVVAAILAGASFMPALASQSDARLAEGTVVQLQGTPHLWLADAQGVLHWGGDTRALGGRTIDWNLRVEVSLEELKVLEIGSPWLSAGLLKEGNPIYLVKWESGWPRPKLLHIPSIADVELFGIDGSNYGDLVWERAAWESRYGFSVEALERSTLESAANPASPDPSPFLSLPLTREAVLQRILSALDGDDNDDDDEDSDTATATATATATGAQTATATATATDDGTSVTDTATVSTATATITATDTATATATGAQTATATATATDDGTSVTDTATDSTADTDTASDTDDTDGSG